MLRGAIVVTAGLAVAGCASVPTAAPELQVVALTFKPSPGMARIYVSRAGGAFGGASKLSVAIDSQIVGRINHLTKNASDVASITFTSDTRHACANINVIRTCCGGGAGTKAQRRVVVASVAKERVQTVSGVFDAGGIDLQCACPSGRVAGASAVVKKGVSTDRRVAVGSVKHECVRTDGRVELAALALTASILTNRNVVMPCAVVPECAYTDSYVVGSRGVGKQRAFAHRSVSVASGIAGERPIAERIVEWPCSVAKECLKPKCVIIIACRVAEQGECSIRRVRAAGRIT